MIEITSLSRVVSDLSASIHFYCEALGFAFVEQRPCAKDLLDVLAVEDAGEQATLQLGQELVVLVQFARSGSSPAISTRSNDLWFQHIAIVVNDIDRAYQHLCSRDDWQPISEGGPQRLPPSDGSVRAFKFKGPDGHPFELIWFPKGQGRDVWANTATSDTFLGIDHTAIGIASTAFSVAFYRSLGFGVTHQSLNLGPKQSMLDAVGNALVDVTSLRPSSNQSMGIELLRYHPEGRKLLRTRPENLITDWINLRVHEPKAALRLVHDPDGHRVLVHTG